MRRSIVRLVALFFLFSAARDLCYPCLEKLESVGLIPDHCEVSLSHSTGGAGQNWEEGEVPSDRHCGVDDDCFCCRGDVLVEAIGLELSRTECFKKVLSSLGSVPSSAYFGVLTHCRPPPTFELRLESDFQPSKKSFWSLQEMLSEDLLPPPVSLTLS